MRIRIGIAGDGSEAEFLDPYRLHPDGECFARCRLDGTLPEDAPRFPEAYARFGDLLADPRVDAVHLAADPRTLPRLVLEALRAGKHVACAPPLSLAPDDCRALVAAARGARRTFMLMDASVYSREFLHAKRLLDQGELGRVHLLRAFLDAPGENGSTGADAGEGGLWPAVGSLLGLLGLRAREVRHLDPSAGADGAPFPARAVIQFRDSPLAAEIAYAPPDGAEAGGEGLRGFQIHGDKGSFEWRRASGGRTLLFRDGTPAAGAPDFAHLLPRDLRAYARAPGGREEARSHLVHEFLRSVAEGRPSAVDEAATAHWASVGHGLRASELQTGAAIALPDIDAD